MDISKESSTENILFELNPLPMWIYDQNSHKIIATNKAFKQSYSQLSDLKVIEGRQYKTKFCAYHNSLSPSHHLPTSSYLKEDDILESAITWQGSHAMLLFTHSQKPLSEPEVLLIESLKKNQDFVTILECSESGKYKVVGASFGENEKNYWSENQLIGNNIDQLFNVSTFVFLNKKFQKCISSKESIEFNFHGNFSKLGRKIFQITVEPKIDQNGAIRYLACIGRDVTERHTAIEGQSFRSKIIDSIGLGIISSDLKGTITFVNQHTCQVLGYKREELIGTNILNVFEQSAELNAFFFDLDRRLSNTESLSIETKTRKKNGQLLSYLVTTSAIFSKNNKLKGFVGIGADLSEIKEKEAELKSKTEQLKYALESADMVSWVYQLDSQIIQRTGPIAKLLNISNQDNFLSSPEFIETVIHPQDRKRVGKSMKDAKKGKPFFETYRIITPNGETKWVEDSGKMQFDEKGKPIRLGGIMQDVTEVKIKEQIIRDSEFTLKSLLNNTSQAFCLMDRNHTILKLNLEGKKLLSQQGLQVEEGQKFSSVIPPDEFDAFILHFNKALSGISTETQISLNFESENRYYTINYNPAFSNSNQITGVVFSVTDITENKKYQNELEKLSLVASKMTNGVVIMDPNEEIEWINDGFTRITKYTLQDVIGRYRNSLLFGMQTEPETVNQYFKNLESKKSFSMEIFTQDKYANHLWLNINITPILDKAGEVRKLIAIESDITDKKLRGDERIKLIDELTKQNTNLKQFSYIVSHNVRKPVANILGLYSLIEMGNVVGEERDELIQYIGNSIEELDYVIRDLNNILDIRDNFDQTKSFVRFEDLVQKVISILKEEIKKNKTKIVFDHLEIDGIQTISGYFHSILYNLISNSIKYRQLDVEPEIEIKVLDKGEFVEIIVSDNGLGMNLPEIQSSLFGLYKRFHHHIEGKGIGLYMIKTQTEAMGGRIEVSSKENEGTSFSVFLKK